MPVITTYRTIYASFSTVDSASFISSAADSVSTSSTSGSRTPLLLSTPDGDKKDNLPTIIAVVVGVLGALVLTVAACVVIRSRLRVRRAEAQFNQNARTIATNANTPQQPAPRLKPLSFLQGREGPKEWIPGGNGPKRSGGSMKSKRTLSLRKSFLSRISRVSKLTIPMSANTANGQADASSSGHGGPGLVVPESDFNNIELTNMHSGASTSTLTSSTKYLPQSSIEQFQANGSGTLRRRSSAAVYLPTPPQQQQQRPGPVETTIKFERSGGRTTAAATEGGVDEGLSSTAALIKALNIESPQPAKMPLPSPKSGAATLTPTSPVRLEFQMDRDSKRVSRPMSTYQMWLAVAEQEEAEKKKAAAAATARSTSGTMSHSPPPAPHIKIATQVKPIRLNRAVPSKSRPITTPDRNPAMTSTWFDDDETDGDMFSVPKRTIELAP